MRAICTGSEVDLVFWARLAAVDVPCSFQPSMQNISVGSRVVLAIWDRRLLYRASGSLLCRALVVDVPTLHIDLIVPLLCMILSRAVVLVLRVSPECLLQFHECRHRACAGGRRVLGE
jgi:hypothetical protein